jgi:hypothetical protein
LICIRQLSSPTAFVAITQTPRSSSSVTRNTVSVCRLPVDVTRYLGDFWTRRLPTCQRTDGSGCPTTSTEITDGSSHFIRIWPPPDVDEPLQTWMRGGDQSSSSSTSAGG